MHADPSRTFTLVAPNLAIGGFLAMDCARWDYVVSCAAEAPPPRGCSDARALHILLDDLPVDWRRDPEWCRAVLYAASCVAKHVSTGHQVLVACHLGHNRAALVAGLAMRMLGAPAAEVVRGIRAARGPEALANTSFEEFLTSVRLR